MKITLNFDTKEIYIENKTNLLDLMEYLPKILPNYQGWTLQTNTKIHYVDKIIEVERNRPWKSPFWYTSAPSTINCGTVELDELAQFDSTVTFSVT